MIRNSDKASSDCPIRHELKRSSALLLSIIFLFLVGCNTRNGVEPPPPVDKIVCEKFTIVVLPDTQIYARYYPDIFTSQTQWIVNNKEELNIKTVMHLGDIVDMGYSETQWANTDTSMSLLDGVVPYFLIPGNHDYQDPTKKNMKDSTLYNTYFPYWRFDIYDWYGGHYPDDKNNNNYGFFTVGDKEFLIIGLEFCPDNKTLEWADGIIKNNQDKEIIFFTHAYLNEDNSRIDIGDWSDCSNWAFCQGQCNSGQAIWDKLISKYSNIRMVLCGHVIGDGLGMRTDYVNGEPVYQILQNYQMLENGGNGYLRCYEFDYDNKVIRATTYSPYLNEYKEDTQNKFKLEWR